MKVLTSQHILHVKRSPCFFSLKQCAQLLYSHPHIGLHNYSLIFSFETAKRIRVLTFFISLTFVYPSLYSSLYFQQPSGMTLTVINIDDLLIDHGNFIQSTDIIRIAKETIVILLCSSP